MAAKNSPSLSVAEMEKIDLRLTRVFAAPRMLVFNAWTDPAQMAQWFAPRGFTVPVCELDVRPGGAIFIHMQGPGGETHPMTGTFNEVVPPEKLVFSSFVPDGQGGVCFEILNTVLFTEKAGQTTLSLRAQVVKATPAAAPMLAGMEEGWTQTLEKLGLLLAVPGEPLITERVYNAPIASVWHAISDEAALREWLFNVSGFKPEKGYAFTFDGGKGDMIFYHRFVVAEVIPLQKLAYTWRYEGHPGDSLVTIELFAEGAERTRLRLTHTGLDTFPKISVFARGNFTAGWSGLLGMSLPKYLRATADPDCLIVTTRVFAAPRELVWKAWTEPEHVAQWFGPNGFTLTIHEMDVRPGGAWRFIMHGPDGRDYKNHSLYTEVDKPKRLVYEHTSGPKFLMTVTFDEADGQTTQRMRMRFDTAEEREKVVQEFGAVEGAQQTVARLADYLTKME